MLPLLEADIFSLLDAEKFVFNNHNQTGDIAGTINNHFAEKLITTLEEQIEMFKKMLAEKDLRIKELEKKLL